MTHTHNVFPFQKTVAQITLLAFACAGGLFTPAHELSAASARPLPAAETESPIQIVHDPLACVTADFAPKVDASVDPGKIYAKGYVFFRAAATDDYYYVLMAGKPNNLEGVLPRPLPDTPAIEYFLQATDMDTLEKKTPKAMPPVVADDVCQKKSGVAVGASGAGLTIGLTKDGQNPVPRGFNKKDIAKVILVGGGIVSLAVALKSFTGGSAGSSAGTTAAAGGSGTLTAIAVAAGAAAVGITAAVSAGGSGGGGSTTPGAGALTLNVSASPSSGQAPLAVQLSSSVTGGTAPYAFTWSFGDGSAASTLPSPAHTYQSPGTYTAALTVKDAANNQTSASTTVTASGPQPIRFLEGDVAWSGSGNVDLTIVNAAGANVGSSIPAGCESTLNRTERVLLQGTVPAGTYTVKLSASTCDANTPGAIATLVTALTDAGPISGCASKPVSVPVGQTVTACTISVP